MLAKAILVHGVIGYKFCWLLSSEDHNQGTSAGHESNGTTVRDHWEDMNQLKHQLGTNQEVYKGCTREKKKRNKLDKNPTILNHRPLIKSNKEWFTTSHRTLINSKSDLIRTTFNPRSENALRKKPAHWAPSKYFKTRKKKGSHSPHHFPSIINSSHTCQLNRRSLTISGKNPMKPKNCKYSIPQQSGSTTVN